MAGDELDDQLDYQISESEGSDAEIELSEDELSDSPEITAMPAPQDAGTVDNKPDSAGTDAEKLDKKAKAKAKQKERKQLKNELDREQKQNLALLEPAYIADYIAKLAAKTKPELSGIELHDRTVPESQIIFTGNKVQNRQNIEKYRPFFEQFGLIKKPQGKTLVLVLCMSAIRVCEVVRALRGNSKSKNTGAIKLIKQNKPEYDQRCLRSPAHIAVSTPGRIYKLQELGILDFKRIKQVVVDTSLLDSKQRTIWDLEGTIELVAELARKNDAKIYLY